MLETHSAKLALIEETVMRRQNSVGRAVASAIILAGLIGLFGCRNGLNGDPAAEAVAADLDALTEAMIDFADGDDLDRITADFTVPIAGAHGSSIAWSCDVAAVAFDGPIGVVARPDPGSGDAAVSLTAVVSKLSASDSKVFVGNVIEMPLSDEAAVASAAVALSEADFGFGGSDDSDSVTLDFVLPTEGEHTTTISWISSDAAISISGSTATVSRPAYGDGNTVLTLTATIQRAAEWTTKTFAVTVLESPKPDALAVSEDLAALGIEDFAFGGTDSAASVTQDFTVSTSGDAGCTISWASSDGHIVFSGGDGAVYRPLFGEGDATVTVTATVSKGTESDTKDFHLVVVETPATDAEAVAEAKQALDYADFGFASGDDEGSVTEDFTVPTSGLFETVISWSSGDSAVSISNGAATVTRPAYGDGDVDVSLTATISRGTASNSKYISVRVRETPQSDAQAVAEDIAELSIADFAFASGDSASSVTQNFMVPVSGDSGTSISWTSDDTAVSVAGSTGNVTRPDYGSGDASVTLTATVSKEVESDTKDFALTVIEAPMTDALAVNLTIDDLDIGDISFALGNDEDFVTADFTAPTSGLHGTAVSWSSNSSAISFSGGTATVTQPSYGSGNESVHITATVSKGAEWDTESYNVSVEQSFSPPTMISVPAKTFYVGTTDGSTASVSSSYRIGETETDYYLWDVVYRWATAHGYTFQNEGEAGANIYGSSPEHPVTVISWRDAVVWCNAISEYHNIQLGTSLGFVYENGGEPLRSSLDADGSSVDGVTPDYGASGYRLPTPEEWELGARFIEDLNSDGDILDAGEYYPGNYASGADNYYNQGSASSDIDGDGDYDTTPDVAWYNGNGAYGTKPVRSLHANALGLYDMSGNVFEWCFDDYYKCFDKGGAYCYSITYTQVGYWTYTDEDAAYAGYGFRLSRSQ